MTMQKQHHHRHNPNHGRTYIVRYAPALGVICTFTMTYNGHKFNTPYSHAFHEASLRCRKIGIEKPVALLAYRADKAFIPIAQVNMHRSAN